MPTLENRHKYYARIGAPQSVRERCEELIGMHQTIYGWQPELIFLEDTVSHDGNRSFPTLCFYSKGRLTDMPTAKPNWKTTVGTLIGTTLASYTRVENFDFLHAVPESRLEMRTVRGSAEGASFTATGENCLELAEWNKEIIFPLIQTK